MRISKRLVTTRTLGAGVLVLFLLSGFCGLLHEVVWTRLLRHVLGGDRMAVTTVLAVFMAGLAFGSHVGGKLSDRRRDPLLIFALLEGAIALYCLLLPALIDATLPLYRLIYQHTQGSPHVFALIRCLFCALLLIVPATCMGATLPVLGRFFVSSSTGSVGRSLGHLYAVNTFGAALGASVTGFLLIPGLGVRHTLLAGCLLGLAICLVSYLLHRQQAATGRLRSGTPVPSTASVASRTLATSGAAPAPVPAGANRLVARTTTDGAVGSGGSGGSRRRLLALLLIAYGLSGFAALVYEIAWTRALSLLLGSSVYAFSLMLTAFIVGLAIGSAVYARLTDRVRDPLMTLAGIEVSIGLAGLLTVPAIGRLPFVVTRLIAQFSDSFWLLQGVEFALVMAIMLIPAALMGAAFPLVCSLAVGSSATAGRAVGRVYGSNTIGCVVGAIAGGFVLIPWLGIQQTIVAAVWVNVLVGCCLLLISPTLVPWRRGLRVAAVIAVVCLTIIRLPVWAPSRMSFGPFNMARRLPREEAAATTMLERRADASRVLFHKDGLATTVTVKEFADGGRTLIVGGKPDASSYADLKTQVLLAQVPLLLHPEPRSALVIGLGSGITLGSAATHPLDRLDCVEISPAVIEACRYFDDHNGAVLDDPRVDVTVADGRHQIAWAAQQYDVIISEPSNPWIAGIGDLFTQEFFQLCRQRLNPGGVLCVWVEAYQIDRDSFCSVAQTFQSIFPGAMLWSSTEGDYLLIGARDELAVDASTLTRRMQAPAIAADLERVMVRSAPELLGHLVMGRAGVARFSAGAPLHTDDSARLEYALPRHRTGTDGPQALLAAIEAQREVDLSFLIEVEHLAGDVGTLVDLEVDAGRIIEAKGLRLQALQLLVDGQEEAAIDRFGQALAVYPEQAQEHNRLANALIVKGRTGEAIEHYRQAIEVEPDLASAHFNLAVALRSRGDLGEAARYYRQAIALAPDLVEAHYNLGNVLQVLGEFEQATEHYRRAIGLRPAFAEAHNNLANVLRLRGRSQESISHYRQALRAGPDLAVVQHNLSGLLQANAPMDEPPDGTGRDPVEQLMPFRAERD